MDPQYEHEYDPRCKDGKCKAWMGKYRSICHQGEDAVQHQRFKARQAREFEEMAAQNTCDLCAPDKCRCAEIEALMEENERLRKENAWMRDQNEGDR